MHWLKKKKKNSVEDGIISLFCFLTLFAKGDTNSNKLNSNFGIQITLTLTRFQSAWNQVKKTYLPLFFSFFGFRKLLVALNFLVTWLTWLGVFYSRHKIKYFMWWWMKCRQNESQIQMKWEKRKEKKWGPHTTSRKKQLKFGYIYLLILPNPELFMPILLL